MLPEHFPESCTLLLHGYKEIFSETPPDSSDFIVIAGPDHPTDLVLLQQAAETSAHYIGLMGSKKKISSLLPLPKRVTKAFLIELDLEDKAYHTLTEVELQRLQCLSHYVFAPAGTFGYSKAEVTKGGVEDTSEVDSATMMSKKEEGLYFIGEVLDVTGRLGGYNFQWAFSSAFICAKHIKGKRNGK